MVKRQTKRSSGRQSANYTYAVPSLDGRNSMGSALHSTMESVCALTNPFCPAAKGSKIPDDDSANSIAITVKDTHLFSTDANGLCAFSVQANLNAVTRSATTFSSGVPTVYGASTAVAEYASYDSSFDQYRIVSFGVRVYSTLAPTEQSGAMRFITSAERATAGAPLTGGLFDSVDTYPVANGDIHWVSKPIGTTWKEYRDFGTLGEYNALNVYIYGAKASVTDAFTVEIIFNLECTVNIGSVTAAMSTPGADHNPMALTAASKTHSKHSGIHHRKSFFGSLWTHAKNALLDTAQTFLPGMAGSAARAILGGRRPAYSTPMIVD
jgi:hypothetical protein